MAHIHKTALVNHSSQTMFDLIDRVEHYPEFLPWCAATDLILRNDSTTTATLHLDYQGVQQSFTTSNKKQAPSTMVMHLTQGPFSDFLGEWQFIPLATSVCQINFQLRYEFENKWFSLLATPVFNSIANTLVDRFINRADTLLYRNSIQCNTTSL